MLIQNHFGASNLQIELASQTNDGDWDDFLATTAGGHHVQTSSWAQVKALLGYKVVRFGLTQPGTGLVGGAQILIRQVAPMLRAGYISKGPVLADHRPTVIERAIQAMKYAARQARLLGLLVQPGSGGEAIAAHLIRHAFQPVTIELAPIETVILDLHHDTPTLMAQMKSKTRYNIRLGQRKGVTVRQGDETDFDLFYRLVQATGLRQQFNTYPAAYYKKMWQQFRPKGLIHLFIADCEHEAVSAALVVAYQDTVIYKMGGWSGHYSQYHPNEVMHWHIAQWAREAGYHFYDFEGIESGQPNDHSAAGDPIERSVSSFKLGFGGQITRFPSAYLYLPSPVLHSAYRWAVARSARAQLLKQFAIYLRTR